MPLLKQFGVFQCDWKIANFIFFQKFTKCNYIYLTLILILFLSVYTVWNIGYFKRRGIKCLPCILPFFGNLTSVILKREHIKDLMQRAYNTFSEEKYFGQMHLNKPIIVLRDLDLIKKVLVTDFDYFVNHMQSVDNDCDSLFANHLFALRDRRWREMRATLTPTFSTAKIKLMFQFVTETADQMTCLFENKANLAKNNNPIEVEIKDAFGRYINDVIATTTFGLVINSLNDQNSHFYEMGKMSTNLSNFQIIKYFLHTCYPKLMKVIRLQIFDERVKHFFRSLVLNTMKFREKEGIYRPDMIHLLQEARNGPLKYNNSFHESSRFCLNINESRERIKWTDDDIVAQAMLIFIAGFDNSSTLLCYIVYELAKNVNIQKKLHKKIDQMVESKGKNISYEDLSNFEYMEMVVLETLRLWPPVTMTDRQCTRTYKLPPTSNNDGYTLKPGDGLVIPIYSIHRDPKYFPNPEVFYPERFSNENRLKVNKIAFLSFGLGPRHCIGQRFAMMVVKCIIFYLMTTFEFVLISKTKTPSPSNMYHLSVDSVEGLWIGLKKRKT